MTSLLKNFAAYCSCFADKLAVVSLLLLAVVGKAQIHVEGDAQIFLGDSAVLSVVKDDPVAAQTAKVRKNKPEAKLLTPPRAFVKRVAHTKKKTPTPSSKIYLAPAESNSCLIPSGSLSHAAQLRSRIHIDLLAATLGRSSVSGQLGALPCSRYPGYLLRDFPLSVHRKLCVRPPPVL